VRPATDFVQLTAEPPAHNLAIERSTAIRDHFPFPTIRPAQEKMLDTFVHSVQTGKKFTIIECPTGGGKSGTGIAAASWSKTLPAFGKSGAYLLSPQKSLTAQYLRDFSSMGLLEMRGKANYHCNTHDSDCDTGALLNKHTHGGDDRKVCDDCPYTLAKKAIVESPLGGVMNFAYYLNETQYAGQLGTRTLLVLDEAHSAEEHILGFVDNEITQHKSEEYGSGRLPFVKPGENSKVREWCLSVFRPAAQAFMTKLEDLIESAKYSNNRNEAVKLAKKLDAADKFICRLNRFLNNEDLSDWFCWSEKESGNLIVKPLTAVGFAEDVFFRKAAHILMMSATILDFPTVMRNLGISRNDAECLALPSDFPKENRPIFYKPVGLMSYNHIDNTLPKLAKMLEKILLKYPDKKGIIHTHSFKVNRFVVGYLKEQGFSSRIITHT